MFKELTKLLTKRNIIVLVVVLVLVGGFYFYSNGKTSIFDNMAVAPSAPASQAAPAAEVAPLAAPQPQASGYTAQPIADPSQLLPKDTNSGWSTLNPTAGANNVIMPDLLNAGYHIGLDTIGQTLKNPNLQLRSEPIIEKKMVSPWNNSSFEGDIGRVPLELGYGTA